MSRRLFFIDKDGTLVDNLPYNVDPLRVRLVAGAPEALRVLHRHDFAVVVISNQPGVALGVFEESALAPIDARLRELFSAVGVPLAGFYYCPHHPSGERAPYRRACDCRKPLPGLLQRAARELDLSLVDSWMVGDMLDDVEAGFRAGCRTILLDNGDETEWALTPLRSPDFIARDWAQVTDFVVAGERMQERDYERERFREHVDERGALPSAAQPSASYADSTHSAGRGAAPRRAERDGTDRPPVEPNDTRPPP